MENILINLLEANNRVIVPELGAFILRQKDPRELAFNDLLAFNDGMLSDHLEKTEGLSSEEAEKRIKEFVADTKNNLSKGKNVKLEGLGILSMDAAGKILFSEKPFVQDVKKPVKKSEPEKEDIPSKESTGGESFILADQSTEVDVDASDDAPLESDKEEPPFTIEKETEPEPEPEPDQEPVKSEEPKPPVEKVDFDKDPEPVKSQEAEVIVQPAASQESIPTYITRTEKKRVWPWIVGPISLLVILVVIAWFVFPEKVNTIMNRQAASENEIPAEPVQEIQAPVEEEPVPAEPEPEIPAVQVPPGKQYYVVAGCFEKIENAESYVTNLKGKGYDSRIFGMRKNLHAVCFNSHPDKSEALSEMNRIRLQYDPSAWVLYY
jgi:hypothetical protein